MKRTSLIATTACLLLTAAGLQAALTSVVTGTVYLQTNSGNNSVVVPATGTLEGTFQSNSINFSVTNQTDTLGQYLTSGGAFNITIPNTGNGGLLTQMSSFGGTTSSPALNPTPTGPGFSYEIVYTGNATLAPGETVKVNHDDGIVLVVNGSTVINSPSPTVVTTDSYTNGGGALTNVAFTLYYEATHGNPSITQVSFAAVPEPTSILLLGTAFLGLGTLVRKKFRKA